MPRPVSATMGHGACATLSFPSAWPLHEEALGRGLHSWGLSNPIGRRLCGLRSPVWFRLCPMSLFSLVLLALRLPCGVLPAILKMTGAQLTLSGLHRA